MKVFVVVLPACESRTGWAPLWYTNPEQIMGVYTDPCAADRRAAMVNQTYRTDKCYVFADNVISA